MPLFDIENFNNAPVLPLTWKAKCTRPDKICLITPPTGNKLIHLRKEIFFMCTICSYACNIVVELL